MNFTIPQTKSTRAIHFHAGTAWAEGVIVPHVVIMFMESGRVEAMFALTLFKKIEQKFRKPRHVMLITDVCPIGRDPQPSMSKVRELWAEAA